jgi:hypothetical protein
MHDVLDHSFATTKILFHWGTSPLRQVYQLAWQSSHNYKDIYLRLALSAVRASSTFIVTASLLTVTGETRLNLVGDS